MTDKKRVANSDAAAGEAEVACGLIMPISPTSNHDERHWAAVQTLLHRGIRAAGMVPANVWEGVNDRISKRIVSNIFRQEVVVADISDLNPNVMLELGLRLASKKPTVVVFNKGGRIPFDITDVEAIPYPPDLNILDMEGFFEKFTSTLNDRLTAYRAGTYEPYLADVVVEVLEPQTKEVSIQELVLERLDEIGARLSRLERGPHQSFTKNTFANLLSGSSSYASVPKESAASFVSIVQEFSPRIRSINEDDTAYFRVDRPSNISQADFNSKLVTATAGFDGDFGIPENILSRFRDLASDR